METVVGIDAQMIDETGAIIRELLDPHSFVASLLTTAPTDTTVCLRFVDPYGDTVFNQRQLPVLLSELEAAVGQVTDPASTAHARQLTELVRSAIGEAHTYVRFIGD